MNGPRPEKRNRQAGAVAVSGDTGHDNNGTPESIPVAPGAQHRVTIRGRTVQTWATYRDPVEAHRVAQQLRVHGMDAAVERVDDEQPEHNGDRRRFLVWALMLGAVPPERVVERVIAEIAQEATT